MASPLIIIPQLEGYLATIGSTTVTGAPGLETEPVFEWINVMKRLMRQPFNRDLTDWAFFASRNIVAAGTVIVNAAATVYGILAGNVNTAKAMWVLLANKNGLTFDPTLALDATTVALVNLPAAATAATREYQGTVYENGLVCGTALTVCNKGFDGTAPTANDVNVAVLYRS